MINPTKLMRQRRFQPMKGVPAPADLSSLRYPILASEKIDGWRALVVDIDWARDNIPCAAKHQHYFDRAEHAIVLSASLKPISNWSVQRRLDRNDLIGCDGELIASEQFNQTSSALASHDGVPAFAFCIFDLFNKPNDPFRSRLLKLQLKDLPLGDYNTEFRVHPHEQLLDSMDLTEFLDHLPLNAEGAVTRNPLGLYKFGRATLKQQDMLKIKPFTDAEAVVIGVEELLHNENDSEINQLGLQRRSHHKAGRIPSGKLGALRCRSLNPDGTIDLVAPEFKIGTGFTDADRCLLWLQRTELYNRIVKFKSMRHGELNAPRHPVFLGFRAEDYAA